MNILGNFLKESEKNTRKRVFFIIVRLFLLIVWDMVFFCGRYHEQHLGAGNCGYTNIDMLSHVKSVVSVKDVVAFSTASHPRWC
jgi:hypothetical protein